MKFLYRYQNSENVTREDTIDARDRQEVYAKLKKLGIKPMAVVQCPLTPAQKLLRAAGALFIVAAIASTFVALFWTGRKTAPKQEVVQEVVALAVVDGGKTNIVPQVAYPLSGAAANAITSPIIAVSNGQVRKGRPAKALARQAIRGDRVRLEKAIPTLFEHPAELFLAEYAEPGRKTAAALAPEIERDIPAALKTPILVYDDELTECVDMKRIVSGMKSELAQYLADGGTAAEYAAELAKRQAEEIEFRKKWEEKLAELSKSASQEELYSAWLKAEAALKSWGISPIPMPRELQGYQPDWDLDEF